MPRYGQTGSGKTYSISGVEARIVEAGCQGTDNDGIIPRAMRELMVLVQQRPQVPTANNLYHIV